MHSVERSPEFLVAEAEWNHVFGIAPRLPLRTDYREPMIALNGCGMPSGKRFEAWVYLRSMTAADRRNLINRGEGGRPRLPQRCTWPLGPCAPGCTAKHIDLSGVALDEQAA